MQLCRVEHLAHIAGSIGGIQGTIVKQWAAPKCLLCREQPLCDREGADFQPHTTTATACTHVRSTNSTCNEGV